MGLYDHWDALAVECDEFHGYAQGRLDEFRAYTEENVCSRVMSAYSSGLGIASPSRLTRYIIRKFKPGRAIKNVKPGQLHEMILYDKDGRPLAIESYDRIPPDGGMTQRSETTYFTVYGGSVWTAVFSENHGWIYDEHYKIVCDDMHRLTGFYQMNAHMQQVYAEEYDYSEIGDGIVTCLFTDYNGKAVNTSKDIPVGFAGSPAIQWRYVIDVDEKGKYAALTTYRNTQGEFVFNEHVEL